MRLLSTLLTLGFSVAGVFFTGDVFARTSVSSSKVIFKNVALGPDQQFGTRSETISLIATKDTISFSIFIYSKDSALRYIVDEARDPDGIFIIEPTSKAEEDRGHDLLFGPSNSLNPSLEGWRIASLVIPNSNRVQMKPGRWSLRISGYKLQEDRPVSAWNNPSLLIVEKTGRLEKAKTGGISLKFYSAGGKQFSSDFIKSDPTIQSAISVMKTILSSNGDLIVDADLAKVEEFSETSESEEFFYLSGLNFEKILGHFSQVLSVPMVWVRALGDVDGAALSGNLTGPIGLSYPFVGGVFLADPRQLNERQRSILGGIIAHEVLHYLGLGHTFDIVPGKLIDDQFADTPSKYDGYLMEPGLSYDARKISEEQKSFLKRSPFVTLFSD